MFKNELEDRFYKYKKLDFSNDLKDCAWIDISQWGELEKESLFIGAMRGINLFYFIFSEKRAAPVGHFFNILYAMDGKNDVQIYRKAIKWFPEHIKEKIRSQGISFEDLY